MKEIIHILPPVCEPTTYLDLFFTKVKGLFSSRFRRTYMVQSVFEDTAGKIAVSLQNQGVWKPDGLMVFHVDKVFSWPHHKLLAKLVSMFHFNYSEVEHHFLVKGWLS